MNDFELDPTTQIAIIWSIQDVQENHPLLTDQQALEVLKTMKNHHDANVGINWETIDFWVSQLYPDLKGDL
jgi:hypothetical protein